MPVNRNRIAIAAALLVAATLGQMFPSYTLAQPGTTTTIAVTGQQAPDTTAGAVFSSFTSPVLNDAGQVAYEAFLTGTGVDFTNDTGIWRDTALIARAGNAAHGIGGGVNFSSLGNPVLNDAGQVAYIANLTGAGVDFTNDTGIWRDTALIARKGNAAHGIGGGVNFSSFISPVLNDAGQVAYFSFLTGTGVTVANNSGIWRDTALIVREGNAAFGIGGGVNFSFLGSPVLNDAGQVAYFAALAGTGVTGANDESIWRDFSLIAREGNAAHGIGGGVNFSSFGTPVLNDAGQVAYLAFLTGTGVTGANNSGIWRDFSLIAREGNPAHGIGGGVNFSSFGTPVLNDAGQVAYLAFLTGTGVTSANDSGIWRDFSLIVREGNAAFGIGGGVSFGSFTSTVLNDAGQVAYTAVLTGAGVTSANNEGIWISGSNNQLLLIARRGDTLTGRTISDLNILTGSGGSDGKRRSLNNFSQVAYFAVFTNGDQGVFLFTPDIHWTRTFSSNWDSSFNWTIGQLPGDPHDVFIDPTVSLTVSGPTGDATMTNLTIGGNNGIATLSLDGGTINSPNPVHVTPTGILTGDGVINTDVTNNGTVTAENVTILGTLTTNNLVTGSGRINAQLNNTTTGDVRAAAGDHLTFTAPNNINAGRIEVIGGTLGHAELEFTQDLTNAASGQMAIRNALLRFTGGLQNQGLVAMSFGTTDVFGFVHNLAGLPGPSDDGRIIISGNSNATFFDDVDNDGIIQVAIGSTAVYFGTVTGTGSFAGGGTNFFEGVFSPGASPGDIDIEGDAVIGSTATLVMELAGTTLGSEYDHLDISGHLTANGSLDVQLLNGFTPHLGDTFDLFDFDSITGSFNAILLPTLANGMSFDTSSLLTTGSIAVVPAPATAWLISIGCLILARRRTF